MKSEVLIFLALAAALAFHRSPEGSACGPGGCLLLPPDFQREAEAAQANAVTALGEKGAVDRGGLR